MYLFKVTDADDRQELSILKDGVACASVSFRSPLDLGGMHTALQLFLDHFERNEVPDELTTMEKGIRDGRLSFVMGMTLGRIEEAIKFAAPDLQKLFAAKKAGDDLGPVAR